MNQRKGLNLLGSIPEVNIMCFELMEYLDADVLSDTETRATIEAAINFTLMMTRFEPEFIASITQKWLAEELKDEDWVEQGHNYCRNFISKVNQTLDKYEQVLDNPDILKLVDELKDKLQDYVNGDATDEQRQLLARRVGKLLNQHL